MNSVNNRYVASVSERGKYIGKKRRTHHVMDSPNNLKKIHIMCSVLNLFEVIIDTFKVKVIF